MKKILLRATSAVLALCMLFSMSACSGENTTKQLEANSALNNMKEITLTCAENSGIFKIKCGEEIVLQSDKTSTVNTVTLREKGSNCTGFSLYGENE